MIGFNIKDRNVVENKISLANILQYRIEKNIEFNFIAMPRNIPTWIATLHRLKKPFNKFQFRQQVKQVMFLLNRKNINLKKQLDNLEQNREGHSRIMQAVAHHLRSSMSSIMSLARIMQDAPGRSVQYLAKLEMILLSGKDSLELINHLLLCDTDGEELKKEPIDLSLALRYCIDRLLYKAAAKEQQVTLSAKPGVIILMNRNELWRAISNLTDNAIKFSPKDTIIHVSMMAAPHAVQIAIEDHGIGIPPEMWDKVFDMYTQAKRPGTANEESFGMGLAISKKIIEGNNGRLWFNGKPQGGTIFFIELPIL